MDLSSHLYPAFRSPAFLMVPVGLFHPGALPPLVPLEDQVFLGSLAVQENHLSPVYQSLGALPVLEGLVAH